VYLYCLDENKILRKSDCLHIRFLDSSSYKCAFFKEIILNTCCPLEPNELSGVFQLSGIWTVVPYAKMFGSTQVEKIPGLYSFFLDVLQTHVIYKEKMANSCAWLIPATQEIGNIQL